MTTANRAKLRLNPSTGEFEVEGGERFVREMLGKMDGLLKVASLVSRSNSSERMGAHSSTLREPAGDGKAMSSGSSESTIPSSFGAYLQRFSPETDADYALIAAMFAQARSSEDNCATRDVNHLLLEEGAVLSHPSHALKLNANAKRMRKRGDRWQVTRVGEEYLRTLESRYDDR